MADPPLLSLPSEIRLQILTRYRLEPGVCSGFMHLHANNFVGKCNTFQPCEPLPLPVEFREYLDDLSRRMRSMTPSATPQPLLDLGSVLYDIRLGDNLRLPINGDAAAFQHHDENNERIMFIPEKARAILSGWSGRSSRMAGTTLIIDFTSYIANHEHIHR